MIKIILLILVLCQSGVGGAAGASPTLIAHYKMNDDLGAPWDISTAVFLQEFSVAVKELLPTDLYFKPDGAKMYTIGGDSDMVDEYDLGTPWDVSTAVYSQEFSIVSEETSPMGLFFKPDGAKMYVTGYNSIAVIEYNLGTPWDITTAVYSQEFSIADKDEHPRDVCFKPDGTKFYTVGVDDNMVDEYNLGTPWDVTTAIYSQEFSVAVKETSPSGIFFKPDGIKFYTIGRTDDTVDEYNLGTPWDITTAVYSQEFSVAVKELDPRGLFFKPDGAKMYTVGRTGDTVDEYDLGAYVIIDETGNHNGAVKDATGTATSAFHSVTGKINDAQDFDGTDDYVEIGDTESDVKSIAMWVNPDAVNVTDSIIDLNGTDYITIVNGTVTKNGFGTGTQIIYVDGKVATTITTNWHLVVLTSTIGFDSDDLDIGREGSSYYDGDIDNVMIFSVVLSPDEVKRLYNNFSGTEILQEIDSVISPRRSNASPLGTRARYEW